MTIHYQSWPLNFFSAHDIHAFSSAYFVPESVMKIIIFWGLSFTHRLIGIYQEQLESSVSNCVLVFRM